MHRNELAMALRTLAFLDSHAADPSGLVELRTQPTRRLLVWHPDALDQMFRADPQLCHAPSRSLSPLLGPRSLLWTDGARHLAYRRLLAPLLRGPSLPAQRDVVSRIVHAALDDWAPGTVIRLPAWTRSIALRVMGRIVLNRTDDALLAPFAGWIDRALGWRPRTLAYRYLGRGLPRSGPTLDRALVRAAYEAAQAPVGTLIGALLAGTEPLGALDDDELRDQIVTLLFAGHETTASATAWALYWLHRDDELRHEVRAELVDTGSDGFDAARVPLLQAVVQETLRLSPPAPVAGNRVLRTDGELLDMPVLAGTVLTPSIYLAHHQPDRFPDPHRFDPRRFLGHRAPAQHYLPFGGGSRHCLGSELAMMEIRLIIAAVLRRHVLRYVNPEAGVPTLRGHAMAPSANLRMVVVE
ncbi:MAG TPA: cytochrome P450 [Pseudonocardiaceae bacterium]|jgi:cytochrome P450|nr:cytochrome P450 [Pseudonocardiaceae bacterium]